MFDSLDEQMKSDETKAVSPQERYMRWALVGLISILIFGGLYFGVHLLEGS